MQEVLWRFRLTEYAVKVDDDDDYEDSSEDKDDYESDDEINECKQSLNRDAKLDPFNFDVKNFKYCIRDE